MTDLNPYLLHVAILAPLLAAAAMLLGGRALSIAQVKAIAFTGFAIPAAIALWLWSQFSGAETANGYAFVTTFATGLERWGIYLTLGLNGISLPLYAMAGVVG